MAFREELSADTTARVRTLMQRSRERQLAAQRPPVAHVRAAELAAQPRRPPGAASPSTREVVNSQLTPFAYV
jgi:hypothetical protein